nr:glycosyltransferase [Hymenolepis microstoma]
MPLLYLKVCVLAALCSTVWNNINDCDETFNYLEPLGFIISKENNTGFQTWEYSPEYGLRSYLYLWFIGWPAYVLRYFGAPGWLQFLLTRLYLSLLSAFSAAQLAGSSSSYLYPDNVFKQRTFGILFCIFHSAAAGNFISASSTVPSAIAASLTSLMLSTWLSNQYFFSIGTVAFSAIILWPFSACLGVPLAIYMIFSGAIMKLMAYSSFWAVALLTPMLAVDSYYYGKLICPTWNIISYNALSALKGKSLSQLYGTESAVYYVNNYILNYNILIVFVAIFTLPVFLYMAYKASRRRAQSNHQKMLKLISIAISPYLIWNAIFFAQSHKEERFLFPCFPCLELLAVLIIATLFFNLNSKSTFLIPFSIVFIISLLVFFVGLSFLRILALASGYSAPMFLVQHLPEPTTPKTLCIGRDWHLFPSHFLLPQETNLWRVHFLRSNFSGQLPGKFDENVGIIKATRVPSSHFNDMNLPEQGTFFDISHCDYILDRVSKPGENEVQYSNDFQTWRMLLTRPILERAESIGGSTNTLLQKALAKFQRAFFLPHLFKTKNVWKEMHILERIRSN